MDRRDFIDRAAVTAAGLFVAPTMVLAQQKLTNTERPPRMQMDLVREFVIAGHSDFDKTRELLDEDPNLLFATWDWGGGDFETALEGAGHVGSTDIANYLISKGARPNIFVLTMLGKTAIVKALLEDYAALLNAKGPHGFTLLHHAERGGDKASELLEYLQSKGLKETKLPI